MNDLSGSSDSNTSSNPTANPPVATSMTSSFAKESEPAVMRNDGMRDGIGQETSIPKEVLSAGVRVKPTSIPIPKSVAQMGVKPAGQNIPVQTTSAIVLPLTDDQIVVGLHQSMANSLRWLAEWCVRRLKQAHVAVTTVGGKLIRGKTQ